METRYQIQVLNSTGQWEFRGGKFSWMSLDNRVALATRKGAIADDVRVWDHQENGVYVPEPVVELTDAQKAERAEIERKNAILNAQYQAEAEAQLAAAQKESKIALEKYYAAVAAAEQALKSKTVDASSYSLLTEPERGVLIDLTVDAYRSTDIDGYGDEGAGYDSDKFVKNLLKLGWVYQPVNISENN